MAEDSDLDLSVDEAPSDVDSDGDPDFESSEDDQAPDFDPAFLDDNRGFSLPLDITDDADADVLENYASSSTETLSQRRASPNFISVSRLPISSTVRAIHFGTPPACESASWKREFEVIRTQVLEASKRFKLPELFVSSVEICRPTLIRILFNDIAQELIKENYEIFHGESPDRRLLEFGQFMATLNLLKVSGLSFSELEDPCFKKIHASLETPMPIHIFKETMKRFSLAFERKNLYFTLEKVFTSTNIPLFYHQDIILGADDDKIPTRAQGLTDLGIKRNVGRGSRAFPTTDDVNTIAGCFTISRATQRFGQSNYNTLETFINRVKKITERTSIPNLWVIDRGFDRASELFEEWFGTLKRASRCIFVEPTVHRPVQFSNQVEIKPDGMQVLYEYRVVTSEESNDTPGKTHIQSAFLSGGTATYMTAPHGSGKFGSELQGAWVAIPRKPTKVPEFQLCPLSILPTGTKIYTSGQDGDCLWHLARASLITSRTAYSLINAAVRLRLPFLENHGAILYFLGFEDFLPYPPSQLTPQDVDRIMTKKRVLEEMSKCGWKPSLPPARLTLPQLKAELRELVNNPPAPLSCLEIWQRLSPILLASMMLRPLAGDKIKAFRLGSQNESAVRTRLKEELNHGFFPPTVRVAETYTIGLAASPEASERRLASSVDSICVLNESENHETVAVEIKSSVTSETSRKLRELAEASERYAHLNFSNAAFSSCAEIQKELDEQD